MKKILFIGCLAMSAQAFSQTTLFLDDFEGDPYWSLQGQNDSGSNTWAINASYNGNAGASIANTPAQPGTFVNGPNSNYMHIYVHADCGGFVPVSCNAHYNPADTSSTYTEMTTDISTLNATNVAFNFWFLCGGEQDESFGSVEYSIDGGTSWNVVGQDLVNTFAWTQVQLTNPAWDNQPSLRFAFHWRNVNSGLNPSLSIDEVTITGDLPVTDGIQMQHMNALSYCPGDTETVGFEATGTFNTGNVFTAQLSDATGSFATPVNIGTLASTANGIQTVPVVFPTATPAGTAYRVRVVSSDEALTGSDNGEDIAFLALPAISVTTTPADGIICAGSSASLTASGATTYTWTPSATLSNANSATPTATPAVTTTYTVTGTEFEGCSNTHQVVITVEDCAGIEENTTASLKVYPNPAKDEVWVLFETKTDVHTIQILDQSGRVIRSIDRNPGNFGSDSVALKIDIQGFDQGVYIARIQYAGGSTSERFTID